MKRRLTPDDVRFLARERVVRLATADRRRAAWVVPVCHAVEDGRIYVGTAASGLKVRNIRRTGRAALVADRYRESWRGLRGVAVAGRAQVFARGPVFERGVKLLYRKYPQYRKMAALEPGESVIIRLIPTRVMSWRF